MSDAGSLAALAAVAMVGVAGWTTGRELGGVRPSRLLVSGAVAALLGVVAGLIGPGWVAGAVLAAVAAVCLAIGEIDARTGLIPDMLVLALTALALVAPFAPAPAAQVGSALGLGGLFLAVRYAYARWRGEEGLGLGDVKLAAAMGALLGAQAALLAVAGAAGVTAVWFAARRRLVTPGAPVALVREAPFGVGLAAATVLAAALSAWGLA